MKWCLIAVSAYALITAGSTAHEVTQGDIDRVKEVLDDVYCHPTKVIKKLEEVRRFGDAAEPALLSIFKDRKQGRSIEWRMTAAILLVGMGSAEGTRLVRAYMEDVADAMLMQYSDEFEEVWFKKLGLDLDADIGSYLVLLLLYLDDIDVFERFVYAGLMGADELVVFLERRPEDVVPALLRALEAPVEKFGGRAGHSGMCGELAGAIVAGKDHLDRTQKGRAAAAIRESLKVLHHPTSQKELGRLLRQLEQSIEPRPPAVGQSGPVEPAEVPQGVASATATQPESGACSASPVPPRRKTPVREMPTWAFVVAVAAGLGVLGAAAAWILMRRRKAAANGAPGR